MPGGEAVANAERVEAINRSFTSNDISAVINQLTGGLIGAVLIFLALYLNFQDNTRDMLILHTMGYKPKEIRRMLVNVYMPITWAAFVLTLFPAVMLARSIQRSLSVSTGDYMPFGTDIGVVLFTFILLNAVYFLVQALFGLGVKRAA